MFKSLFHWKVLINFVIAIGLFIGLVWATFRWLEKHTNHGKEIPVPNVVNMSMQQAIKILDDAGLDYEIDSGKYDPKYKSFQVLQIYPSAGSHVKENRSIRLKINPRTWAPVTVPDVLNKYKNIAFAQLSRVGLKIGDTLYEPSIQPDAVIGMQYNGMVLAPGTTLPRFAIVDLIIGTGPRRNIPVPNLVGMTVAEAKEIIEQNYFTLGLAEYEDGGNDDTDLVYYQDPAPGSLRDQGMQMDLWASKKTLAEMQPRIDALDQVYRVQIDPIEPVYEDFTIPEPRIPAPVAEPKKEPQSKSQPKEKSEKSENQAKPATTSKTKPTEKPTQKPVEAPKVVDKKTENTPEKPKAKKIVIE